MEKVNADFAAAIRPLGDLPLYFEDRKWITIAHMPTDGVYKHYSVESHVYTDYLIFQLHFHIRTAYYVVYM